MLGQSVSNVLEVVSKEMGFLDGEKRVTGCLGQSRLPLPEMGRTMVSHHPALTHPVLSTVPTEDNIFRANQCSHVILMLGRWHCCGLGFAYDFL